MKKYLFVLACLVVSCDGMELNLINHDMIFSVKVCYENKSSHYIELINLDDRTLDNDSPESFIIAPGDIFDYGYAYANTAHKKMNYDHEDIQQFLDRIIPGYGEIIFAEEYVVSFNSDLMDHHDILDLDNYTPTRMGKRSWCFTYTFTDEDCAYAREHGEVVE